MIRVIVIFLSLILLLSIANSNPTASRWNQKNSDIIEQLHLIQPSVILNPDRGLWMTLEIIFNDGVMTDTFSFAQAFFDSSDYGLDADTCWIDSQPMIKDYDSIDGYTYNLFEFNNFYYIHNHNYQFRAKGYGGIPPFIDSIRSPIHPFQLTQPQPYNIVTRGTNLIVQWVPYYEHNVLIEILDTAENMLLYYPLDDNGSFTIPANDIDSLYTGLLYFMFGRSNQQIGSVATFPLISVTASMIQIPIYLQDAPGIEQEPNRTINLPTLEAHPNPVTNNQAKIAFSIADPSQVSLRIYNASGRLVKTIADAYMNSGVYNESWNCRDDNNRIVSEGIYFYTLETSNQKFTKKLILTR